MKEENILKIIEEKEIFTVITDNAKLINIVRKMERENKIEQKDRSGRHCYFGKPDGKPWKLKRDTYLTDPYL